MIPDDDAVTTTFATLKAAVEAAESRERERIIRLLAEQAQFALDNGDALRSDADMRGYQLAVKHSLQLIKGENK